MLFLRRPARGGTRDLVEILVQSRSPPPQCQWLSPFEQLRPKRSPYACPYPLSRRSPRQWLPGYKQPERPAQSARTANVVSMAFMVELPLRGYEHSGDGGSSGNCARSPTRADSDLKALFTARGVTHNARRWRNRQMLLRWVGDPRGGGAV